MCVKKSGSSVFLWTLSLCWVSGIWTLDQGVPPVVLPSRPITAAPGDAVILRCFVRPPQNLQTMPVEWSRLELKPDPSDRLRRVEYVHLYRNQEDDHGMQIPAYISRTELSVDDLKDGNVSLRILNVSLADSGMYRCHIPKLGGQVNAAVVRLVVDTQLVRAYTAPPPMLPRNLPTAETEADSEAALTGEAGYWSWLIAGLMLGFVLVAACVSYLYFRKRQKNKIFQRVMTPEAERLQEVC